jgi:hypothetical protein
MKQEELAHVLRAAANILEQSDFLVIGTAALLGSYEEEKLPSRATLSREADLAPFDEDVDGNKSMKIEGALGLGSDFEKYNTYYADGVDFRTAVAPYGWQQRLVLYNPPLAAPGRGWCLEPYDLAAAKLSAGREKDFEFVAALLEAKIIDRPNLLARLTLLPKDRVHPDQLKRAVDWLNNQLPAES